jgi:hypothetical protein
MKKCIKIASIILLVLFVLNACSNSTPTPPITFDEDNLNSQVLLRRSPLFSSNRTTDPIALELKYNSNNTIIFPNNYNIRIFEYVNDGWKEYKEQPTVRLPAGDVEFSPDKFMPAVTIFYVHPSLPDLHRSYKLRIYISGEMSVNDQILEVGAYTDVYLQP